MLLIIDNELKKVKPIDGINEGSYGKCFKYNDGVLKVFFNSNIFNEKEKLIRENINNSKGIIISDISFPIDIKDVLGYKFSYTMPFIDGISMDEIIKKIIYDDYDISFEDLIKIYNNSLLKIKEISEYGIKTDDIMMRNCKVKEDFSFGIVDVDFFRKIDSLNNEIYNTNLHNINKLFFYFLLEAINNRKYVCSGNKYYNYVISDFDDYLKILKGVSLDSKCYVDDVLYELASKKNVNTIGKLIYKYK